MKRASRLFLILFVSLLFVSLQTYAQRHRGEQDRRPHYENDYRYPIPNQEVLREHVNLHLRRFENIRLVDLLRLSYREQNELSISFLSLKLRTSYNNLAEITLTTRGRLISRKVIRRNLEELEFFLPPNTPIQDIEFYVNTEVYLSMATAKVSWMRRPLPEMPRTQRVLIRRQISPGADLALAELFRYNPRRIRSVTIEARGLGRFHSNLNLVANYSDIQGVIFVREAPLRATLKLRRPMTAQELRITASSPLLLESIEVEYEHY